MYNWSSDKKMKLLFENFRSYIKEEEAPEEAPIAAAAPEAPAPQAPEQAPQGGSWPADPTKKVPITASGAPSPEVIKKTWDTLAAMNPPNDPRKALAQIGGYDTLIANVQALAGNFAGAASNPARIDMPVVDPAPPSDLDDLKARLGAGQLDFKPPFAPDGDSEPDETEFPRGLDKVGKPEQGAYLTKGLKDDDPDDDKGVSLSPATIAVVKSYPTQSAVYLDKSMWNILNFGPTPVGKTAFGKPNLIAIQDGEENHILDGHHRWSSAWISGGPGASIRVQALTGLDDKNIAIAALRSYGNARGNAQKS